MRHLAPLVLGVALLPASAATAADAPQPASHERRLSNERTLSRWAYANQRARVRRSPSGRSKALARLRYETEDGYPEVYPALRSRTDANGRQWVLVRVPMRPNGTVGWVPRGALDELHAVRTYLLVDRTRLRATLYRSGRRVFSAPVGVGKRSTPTPPGDFWIRERIPNLGGGGIYGPLAFGTADYSVLSDWPGGGVIGIHGTDQPSLVPGRPSHGCIRMHNRDIVRLGRMMPVGTPLRVR
jgi:hypothetical protein